MRAASSAAGVGATTLSCARARQVSTMREKLTQYESLTEMQSRLIAEQRQAADSDWWSALCVSGGWCCSQDESAGVH